MKLVSRLEKQQAHRLKEALACRDFSQAEDLLKNRLFTPLAAADTFFESKNELTDQILIPAKAVLSHKNALWQTSDKGIRFVCLSDLDPAWIEAIEPAAAIHRTHILMNTSMIDEKWCRPAIRPYIQPDDHVCVLALSFFDDTKNEDDWNRQYKKGQGIWYRANTDVFFSFGLKENQVHWVNYFKDSPDQIRQTIMNSSVLLLTGGAPDLMMKRIRKLKLLKTLRTYQGLIIGYSAGAMVQLADYHITPDEDYPDFSWQKGIGWRSDFDVEVHYHHSRIQKAGMNQAFKDKGLPVFAIEEQGGMIVDENGQQHFFGKVERFDENHPDYGI